MRIQKIFLFFFLALIPLVVLIASLGRVLPSIGLNTKEKVLSCCSDAEKINWIKNTVDEGKPIILLIKIKKVLHYVTVIGYDEKGFILYDSLQEKTKSNPRKTIKDKPQYYGNRYYEYSGLIKLWDKGGYKIFFKNWALVCG